MAGATRSPRGARRGRGELAVSLLAVKRLRVVLRGLRSFGVEGWFGLG